MSQNLREETAASYEHAAAELERAAQHLRTAARHMRDHEVPRACAHAFAALGHIANGNEGVTQASKTHASMAVP